MNYLKKKLKPLSLGTFTASSSSSAAAAAGVAKRHDLEDDLYDEYVVEAPPHPSELLALGVDPAQIDTNDPEKLRELYKRAKELSGTSGKQVNSVLLARQREKEQIEEKKRTREEWKFFDSLTTRVEQAVKESQKNLEQWKESDVLNKLEEPEYELRPTLAEEDAARRRAAKEAAAAAQAEAEQVLKRKAIEEKRSNNSIDGCPERPQRRESVIKKEEEFVVKELLEDFGLDLRPAELRRRAEVEQQQEALERVRKQQELERAEQQEKRRVQLEEEARRAASVRHKQQAGFTARNNRPPTARARPRPRPNQEQEASEQQPEQQAEQQPEQPDPFDTSFVAGAVAELPAETTETQEKVTTRAHQQLHDDPFDTSYIKL